jgi:hypothetical protein
MTEENANAPAEIGQNASAVLELFNVGSGDGGRRAVQRYELFDHTLSVSTDVVVKRVAVKLEVNNRAKPSKDPTLPRLLLEFVKPSISCGVCPKTTTLRLLSTS